MGIMVYSLFWVMQDFVHQPYFGDSFLFLESNIPQNPHQGPYIKPQRPGPTPHASKAAWGLGLREYESRALCH